MCKEIITFGNIEVEKLKFHQRKSPISLYDVNFDSIVVSNRVSFGKSVLTILLDTKMVKKVKPLCMMLPKMSAKRRDFDKTKYVFSDKK